MIDDKKLRCAFIYGAYAAGLCGIKLGEKRDEYSEIHKEYVRTGENYPEKIISKTQQKMMEAIPNSGIRDYIYGGHFEIVKRKLENLTGKPFDKITKDNLGENMIKIATHCPINYYRVISVSDKELEGENIILGNRKKLSILEGLETPVPGQIVSGHWHHMLEVVSDWPELEKYFQIARNYYSELK